MILLLLGNPPAPSKSRVLLLLGANGLGVTSTSPSSAGSRSRGGAVVSLDLLLSGVGSRTRSGFAAASLVRGSRTRGGAVVSVELFLTGVGSRTRNASVVSVPWLATSVSCLRRRLGVARPALGAYALRARSGTTAPTSVHCLAVSGSRSRSAFVVIGSGRWQLADPVDHTVLSFTINPNAGGSPTSLRPLTNRPTTAPDGATIVFQGEPDLTKGEFSGVLRDLTSYQAMTAWTAKPRMLALTDDLGRVSWIIFTEFTAQRSPRPKAVERRTYTCRYQVVS